jgi:hypothetical protein
LKSRGKCQGEDALTVHATCHKDSLYYTLQERTLDGVDIASIPVIRTRTYPFVRLNASGVIADSRRHGNRMALRVPVKKVNYTLIKLK